ncbi:MAG: TRAP transporter large permease subunit [Proteobacteria bacterium]|nr:TRAP transporter large permease subunit [Pseudomonadota bacterium]
MNEKIILLVTFLVTYLFIITSEKISSILAKFPHIQRIFIYKGIIIWISLLFMILLNIISPRNIINYTNWDIIWLFIGTMVIAEAFILSKIPELLANKLLKFSNSLVSAIIILSAFAGFISIFCENVATVLIVAPIAFEIARKMDVSPVPFIIAIAISSNLQGAALLIGDPPSMILASFNHMKFMDFIIYHGKPSMFFIMETAALVSLIVLYILFRKSNKKIKVESKKTGVDVMPGIILVLFIITISLGIFSPGATALIYATIAFLWILYRKRKTGFKIAKNLDYDTVFFLIGVFVFTGALEQYGILTSIALWFKQLANGNIFITFTILVWGSVIISAFIDNVPYVAAMMPVGIKLATFLGINPSLFLFGIVIGASVGGNISPVGASANIVGIGLLRKRHYSVGFFDFFRIGLPFTFFSVLAAYILLWLIYGIR